MTAPPAARPSRSRDAAPPASPGRRGRGTLAVALAALSAAPGAALAARGDPPPPLLDVEPAPAPPTPAAAVAAPSSAPVLSPADGSVTGSDRPRIEVRFPVPIAPERVTLLVDASDVTGMAEFVAGTVAFQPPRPLAPGPHRVRVVVDGVPVAWSFTCQPGASTAAGASAGPRAEWSVAALGSITREQATGASPDTTARVLLNSRADVQGDHWYARETTDLAASLGLQGAGGLALESRNYVGAAGVRAGGFGAGLQVGYFVPEFLDQSRLLTVGLPGGGVEAQVSAPGFSAGVYQNYDSRPAGVVAGVAGPDQRLRAAGAEGDLAGGRYSLRVMALQATDSAGLDSVGGSGRAVGVMARAALDPAATLLAEVAHGEYTPNPGGADVARSGLALRLGLLGALDGWSWSLDLRRTDDGYVNPANRGFAAGALSDRTGGDATVSKQLGAISLGASARHLQGGTSATGSLPGAREDGGTIFATAALGPAVTLAAAGQATAVKTLADPTRVLPATDSLAVGGTLSATELWHRIQFMQSYSYQASHDAVSATDTRVHTGVLGASGTLVDDLLLGATGSATRGDVPGGAGPATTLTAALQPTLLLPSLWLAVQPQLAWSSSRAPGVVTTTFDAQGQLTWSPPWLRSLFAFQLSGDWSRNDVSTAPPSVDVVRVMASLLMNWSVGSSVAGPAPSAPAVPPAVAAPPGAGALGPGAATATSPFGSAVPVRPR